MAGKGQADILRADTAAVIGYAKGRKAAFLDIHGDGGGAGVHAVFYQFFDGGGRPLHHFAGSNLADDLRGQLTDTGNFHRDLLIISWPFP